MNLVLLREKPAKPWSQRPAEKAGCQKPVTERLVTEIWRRRLVASARLATTQGVPVKVIYPGDMETCCGPDFQQAVVCLDNSQPITGDVEVHLRSSEWQGHKHHRDPAYNGVILHVVLWDDTRKPAPLESGGRAPVVELAGLLPGPMEEVCQQLLAPWEAEEPCHRAAKLLGPDIVAGLLEASGDERFRLKASALQQDFDGKGAEQALYEAVMGALGYSRNKQAFTKLARSLPLELLRGLVAGEPPESRLLRLQALLLGSAGLLDGDCERQIISKGAAGEWETLKRLWVGAGLEQAMSRREWRLSGIRPGNSPLRRLAAASHLIHRFSASGWVTPLLESVLSAPVSRRGVQDIEKVFLVGADSTGAGSFGQKLWPVPPALLGPGRASEIVVNVALPFCFAWAQTARHADLEKKALALYRFHPGNDNNGIIKQMLQRIWQAETPPGVQTAARQQGLTHLYLNFCRERKCAMCPLGSRVSPA